MTRSAIVGRLAGFLALGLLALPAAADDTRGTADQAQSMVAAAVALYDDVGAEAAFARFNTDPVPDFRNGDLYIFVIRTDGTTVAHAFQPTRVGQSVLDMVDANGVHFGKEFIDKATPNGAWVDYVYTDPSTGAELQKSSWVVRHGDYIFGCGIYKQ
jgi:signal transduction histidine kinase